MIRSARIAAGRPPAVLVLAADGTTEWLSDGAHEWVDDLATDGGTLGMPTVITVAAARARAGRATRASIRGRGRSGRWFIVDAAPLETQRAVEDGSRDGDPHTKLAVTVRPAQSGELLSILLERYELTDRELEIVLQLARGHATKEIAAQLYISAHTVRDHIKAIFDKTGVNRRGELVAKLFSEHVLEPLRANVTHSRPTTPAHVA